MITNPTSQPIPSLADSELVEIVATALANVQRHRAGVGSLSTKDLKHPGLSWANAIDDAEAALSAIRTHTATPVGQVKAEKVERVMLALANAERAMNGLEPINIEALKKWNNPQYQIRLKLQAKAAIASLPHQVLPSEDSLRKMIRPLIEAQSCGEWDDLMIDQDTEFFTTSLLAAMGGK